MGAALMQYLQTIRKLGNAAAKYSAGSSIQQGDARADISRDTAELLVRAGHYW